MKKIFLLTVMLAAFSTGIFAESVNQLKSKICIVREDYFDDTKKYILDSADEMNRKGYPDYYEYMQDCIGNSSGSGFVYVAKDGRNFVITNRHVVHRCEGASAEFFLENGTSKKYEHLTVIATDENLDIAVLAFENNEKPFKSGLSFYTKTLQDADEVWTAGYPGLGGEPVWQFGKGTITNSSVAIKDFIDPKITKLIQHSAPVDSGSSGGPLLVKTGDRYEVAGVNTWKFFYRQSANISLPGTIIEKFVMNAINSKGSEPSVENLKARTAAVKELYNAEEADFVKLTKYISFAYVKKEGCNTFLQALRNASSDDRSYIRSAFVYYSPIEGFNYAVARKIHKLFVAEDFMKNAQIADPVMVDDKTYTVQFTTETKKLDSEWVFETVGNTGFWRMDKVYDPDQDTDEVKKSKRIQKKLANPKSSISKIKSEQASKEDTAQTASEETAPAQDEKELGKQTKKEEKQKKKVEKKKEKENKKNAKKETESYAAPAEQADGQPKESL